MFKLHQMRRGGILADEMGLGKASRASLVTVLRPWQPDWEPVQGSSTTSTVFCMNSILKYIINDSMLILRWFDLNLSATFKVLLV
jgi:hypothetical protein